MFPKNISWLKFWGILFLTLVVLNLVIHIVYEGKDFAEVLWFCNLAAFFLAYGLYFAKPEPINGVLAVAIPAQFFWIGDFVLQLFGLGMGRTSWLFESSNLGLTFLVSVLMHALTIPVALWASWKLGFTKRGYIWMMPFFLIMLPITFFFTSPIENRNCVFYPCDLNYYKDYAEIIAGGYMNMSYFLHIMPQWLFVCTSMFIILFFAFRYIRPQSSRASNILSRDDVV